MFILLSLHGVYTAYKVGWKRWKPGKPRNMNKGYVLPPWDKRKLSIDNPYYGTKVSEELGFSPSPADGMPLGLTPMARYL